jgi:hypothetical protein
MTPEQLKNIGNQLSAAGGRLQVLERLGRALVPDSTAVRALIQELDVPSEIDKTLLAAKLSQGMIKALTDFQNAVYQEAEQLLAREEEEDD